jgi:hypothetical protein
MRLGRVVALIAAAMVSLVLAAPASASLLITIDKSSQRMTVSLDGAEIFNWPVSTGAPGYDTPSGEFKPFRMEAEHFSREWDDAPMPHSIFFTMQGHAIHGSYHKSIGQPASHGCVRLEPKNARTLFALVKQEHMSNTRVELTGETPGAAGVAVARRERDYQRSYSTDDDDDFVRAMPSRRERVVRGWREYNDGPRYFYYRERPYTPPQRYGYEGQQVPYPFGR